MSDSEQLWAELHDALMHLFDPDYEPPSLLRDVLGCDPSAAAGTVQTAIIRAIERLCPMSDTDGEGRIARASELLHHRFVMGLTQEDAAERLGLSVRHVGRVQREATHILSRRLSEQYRERGTLAGTQTGRAFRWPTSAPSDEQPLDWRVQLASDLSSLQSSAPGATCRADEAVREALRLDQVLTADRDIAVTVTDPACCQERAAIHPIALRQVLITSLGLLMHHTAGEQLDVRLSMDRRQCIVELEGEAASQDELPDLSLQDEILARFGGSIGADVSDGILAIRIALRIAGDVTVLVIDDNPDMVYFYRRCADGSRYRIVHEERGTQAFEAIAAHAPTIVVLDIMLPDIDGWQLLSQLHEHHATRIIPVIVCSVIRGRELALALGAAGFLPKPFTHRKFRQMLDEVAGHGSSTRLAA